MSTQGGRVCSRGSYKPVKPVQLRMGGPFYAKGSVAQSAEAADLKSVKCGFESHHSHQIHIMSISIKDVMDNMINIVEDSVRNQKTEAVLAAFNKLSPLQRYTWFYSLYDMEDLLMQQICDYDVHELDDLVHDICAHGRDPR